MLPMRRRRGFYQGTRATGVEYLHRGVTKTALAGGEVVLSGGAINSVQLLQLSGIGPRRSCKSMALMCGWDNANVGAHLQDHVGLNYTYRMKVPTLNDELRPWWGKLRVGMRYLMSRSGPLSLSVNQGGGFFRSSLKHERPNMQLYMQAFSTLIPKAGERPSCSRLIPSQDFPWVFPIVDLAAGASSKFNRLIPCSIRELWPMPIQRRKMFPRCWMQ